MTKDLQTDFTQAKLLINKSQRLLLTMHERMDGDDGGSVLALADHLEKTGKEITCVIKQGVPPYLKFLPGSERIQDDVDHTNFDLLIMCGCSQKQRCGSKNITNLKIPILNIDHHSDNEQFGQTNLVSPEKSSVAELVYDFFKFNYWPISKEAATCLLTGIITDTGSFMHSNTTPQTLKAAAHLMRQGAFINKIIKHIYRNKNTQTLKAWGRAMENSFYDEKNKIIYSVVTTDDLRDLGEIPQSAFEGFVSILNTVPEAKFALFVRQDGNVIKGSLRSEAHKQVDVAKIAKIFGGGGHKLAAGFSLVGKLIKDEQGKWQAL